MTDRDPGSPADLDAHLRRLFDQPSESTVPTDDELWAFVQGRLNEQEGEALMVRVADHPEAMDRLLDLRQGAESMVETTIGSGTDALSSDEIARRTEAVLARTGAAIGDGADKQQSAGEGHRQSVANDNPPVRLWWRAASFLLVVGLLALLIGQWRQISHLQAETGLLQQRLETQAGLLNDLASRPAGLGPIVNPQVLDLFIDQVRGSGPSPPGDRPQLVGDAERLSSSRPAVLLITPQDSKEDSPYSAALMDSSGQSVWRGEVRSDASGVVTLSLPAGFLRPGEWLLRLESVSSAEVFPLKVEEGAAAEAEP